MFSSAERLNIAVSCRDHADLRAQRVLGQVADVDAVEQDAPALDLVEPEQQRDGGGLAGAGPAHERHPFAGPRHAGRSRSARRCRARSRRRTCSKSTAPWVRARLDLRLGRVDDRVRRTERAHAVLDLADIREYAHRRHADPAGHLRDARGQQAGRGDVTGAGGTAASRAQRRRR
jgi:hypothetical protein